MFSGHLSLLQLRKRPLTEVVGLVVMGSLLRIWEVKVLDLNLAMGSAWKITSYSRLMLTSVLNGTGCTTMAHLDPLIP